MKTEEEKDVLNYFGHFVISVTESLFLAARRYKVESLKRWCSSILSSKLKKQSAIHLWIFANQNSIEKLKENCIDFIVKKSEYFLDQDELPFSLFFEIIKRKKSMDLNVSSSKRSSREAYLTYEQIQEQTKSKTLKPTVASTKDDQPLINKKLKNYDTFHDNKTETDSQQNDESESDESIDSWGSFASAIRAQYPDAVLKRSNKKKSPSSISKSRTESSSGIDLRSNYSSATSAQTVNTIHQNYRCKYY